ncbi:hypothetical protein [Mycolicibacterium tusciae]|uniref:hypothetical protein n=1 Tax=Mycolicibacterium tusciae TaxID=75922 RepID=UPI00024A47E8|nr:hypothetical protein [Mycolicibacterium tusciae]
MRSSPCQAIRANTIGRLTELDSYAFLAFEDFVALNDRHSAEVSRKVKDFC